MPITDTLLSPEQHTLLRAASDRWTDLSRGTEVRVDALTDLPDQTMLEIANVLRDPYFGRAELYVVGDSHFVVGWHGNARLAVTPTLGTVTENQPFLLSSDIVRIAAEKTTRLPLTVGGVAKADWPMLSIFGAIALFGLIVLMFGRGEVGAVLGWGCLAIGVLAASLFLLGRPGRNKAEQAKVGIALASEHIKRSHHPLWPDESRLVHIKTKGALVAPF